MRKHEGLLHELAGTEQQVPHHLVDLQRRRQTLGIVFFSLRRSYKSSWMLLTRSWRAAPRP